MSRKILCCILSLWFVPPTRETTHPEAFDMYLAGLDGEEAGKLEEALQGYEKAVEIFPEFEAAWLNLSMVHQDTGNLSLAISSAMKATEHLPNSTSIWGNLGTFYIQDESMEHLAENAFRKAIECNQKNRSAMTNLGKLLAKNGRYEEAEQILAKCLELKPDETKRPHDIQKLLSSVRAELQMVGTSSSKEDMSTEEYAKDVAPLLKTAAIFIQRGELSEAEAVYKRALEFNLNTAEILFRLGTLYYQMGRRSDEKDAYRRAIEINEHHVGARIDLASTLIGEGDYSTAEKLLRTVIPDVPNNHFAWMNLGKSFIAQGNSREGEEALKKVIELKPDYVNAHFQLGNLYLRKGEFQQSENAFRKTLQYKPEHVDAWIELGIALSKNDRGEEAEEAWRTAIKYDPNNDAPWINLSTHLTVAGRCDEAKEALTRAQELAPNDEYTIKAELLWKSMCGGGANTDITMETVGGDSDSSEYTKEMNTGAVMFDTGQKQDAEQCYRRAIALDKSNPLGWGMLGSVLRSMGKLDEAERAFTEAFNLPKAAPRNVLLNYTVLLKDLGREDDAEKALLQLTKEHPDFADGWFNLGNLYLKRKDWKQADKKYKIALGQNPEVKLRVKLKWNRGFALKEMKKYKEAEKSLMEALELDPSNISIRKVLAQVRALQ